MGGRLAADVKADIVPPAIASGDTNRKWTLPSFTDSITDSRWALVMLVWRQAPFTPGGRPVI